MDDGATWTEPSEDGRLQFSSLSYMLREVSPPVVSRKGQATQTAQPRLNWLPFAVIGGTLVTIFLGERLPESTIDSDLVVKFTHANGDAKTINDKTSEGQSFSIFHMG